MQTALAQREVLHVEVFLTEDGRRANRKMLDESIQAGVKCLSTVRAGAATAEDLEHLSPSVCVRDSINAIEFDYTGPNMGRIRLDPAKLAVEIHYFFLHSKQEKPKDTAVVDESHARMFVLPNEAFQDLWISLVLDDYIHVTTLHSLIRSTLRLANTHAKNALTHSARSRVCLFYGPPGSGKSSTCRALAQKLSIRLAGLFPKAVLIELQATTLFSKYFGESPQLVDDFFAQVEALAEDPNRLVCVVVDEVDAIAGQRKTVQDDCRDDARATISLLAGLDRIQKRSNVIVFATSNIRDALDPAFVDRTDEALTKYIPLPSLEAIYELLRKAIHELVQQELIRGVGPWLAHDNPRLVVQKGGETKIPRWDSMLTHFSHLPESIPYRLRSISRACAGKSARKICVLPSMAFDSEWGAESTTASNIEAMEKLVGLQG